MKTGFANYIDVDDAGLAEADQWIEFIVYFSPRIYVQL